MVAQESKKRVAPDAVSNRLFNNTTTKLFQAKKALKLAEERIE